MKTLSGRNAGTGRNLPEKQAMSGPFRRRGACSAWTLAGPFILFLVWALITPSSAQGGQGESLVQLEAFLSHETIHPGDTFEVAVVADIKKGFHINSHKPLDEFLVPTQVLFDRQDGVVIGPVSYPQPVLMTFSFSKHKVASYEGRVVFMSRCRLSENFALGDIAISGCLAYQACDDQSCRMPASVKFQRPLKVVGAKEPVKLVNEEMFQQETSFTSDELRAKKIIEKGLAYAFVAFFLFGLALNLTPCVYPVIPMTVSFFVAQSEQSRLRMFALALYYVLGIAIVFSCLGLISGLAGRQWGFMFQSPWFVVVISVVILAMAASMFGAFEITIPSFLMTPLGKSRQGAVGSLVMGLTVGVVIAPCAAGVIIGLVGIVAKLGIVLKGGLLFFVMGLGLGIPYLFLAMSSGMLNRLPRSGMWMVWIRKVFGILLVGVAIYFLLPQASHVADQLGFYFGVLGLFGGLLLGFLEHAEGYTRTFKMIKGLFGLVLMVVGVMLIHGAIQPEGPTVEWIDHRERSVEWVQTKKKPVLIDFYADWCGVCKELDSGPFSDEAVVDKSKAFAMYRVDCTTPDERSEALLERFKVSGLPTLVFLSKSGEEIQSLRVSGYCKPEGMLKKMDEALAR